ncbi:GntR family transcriptional regulator [Mycolicibacterium litorale]|uniref:GntR family transcriptional regulator n=1 Tax=Mycolicibacterium litorale TaxID=758802 RepID=UPI003CEE093A
MTKKELTALIAHIASTGEHRLPSEEELSARLEVSRATVRSALLSLQKSGIVQRVHGRGTYINRSALRVPANISEDRAFTDILREMGHQVSARSDDIRLGKAPQSMAKTFQWDDEQKQRVWVVRRHFEASGDPAVYAVDYVPVSLFADGPPTQGCDSVFDFLRLEAGRQVRYSVADIVPTTPSPEVAAALGVSRKEAILLLEHTHIDESDEPVAFTQAFINDKLLRFSVVRTYTDS